jgi:hypothetical protein
MMKVPSLGTTIGLLLAIGVRAGTLFTAVADSPYPSIPTQILGTIEGVPGFRIHIIELGIGGDASDDSGPAVFSAIGEELSFSWGAGMGLTELGTYTLAGTPSRGIDVFPEAHGFSYLSVSEWAKAGASVNIRWHGNETPKGYYTLNYDKLENFYYDPPGTTRAWVRYEMIPDTNVVYVTNSTNIVFVTNVLELITFVTNTVTLTNTEYVTNTVVLTNTVYVTNAVSIATIRAAINSASLPSLLRHPILENLKVAEQALERVDARVLKRVGERDSELATQLHSLIQLLVGSSKE